MSKFFKLWVGTFAAAIFLCALSLCPTESFALMDVYAEETTTEEPTGAITGSCGTNVTYSIEGDTITISGTGAMDNYSSAVNAPYRDKLSNVTKVVISDGVTNIGESAFERCSTLTSVKIPSSVTNIGSYAFQYCSNLTSITIPSGVTNISDYAFTNCSGLTSVEIKSGVTAIGDHAFYGCSVLTSVEIPSSVTTIGNSAFNGCTKLTGSLTIPNSVISIGDRAFQNCGYDSTIGTKSAEITMLSKNVTIGTSAFENIKTLKCFKGSTAETYATSNSIDKAYIQDQSNIEIKVAKPTDGKWIQKAELIITKDGADKTAEMTQYKLDNNGDYIFPVVIYANSYTEGRSLPCRLRYYYTYKNEAVTDETKLTADAATAGSDSDDKTDGSKVYYKDIPLSNAEFAIVEGDGVL